MLSLIKTLLTIARELKRIREILEIAFEKQIEYRKLSIEYTKNNPVEKQSDIEFFADDSTLVDEYGEEIKQPEFTPISPGSVNERILNLLKSSPGYRSRIKSRIKNAKKEQEKS